ncbi:pilus assembly protein PilW, partial [Pseudomonas sp. BAgro211]|nr:pilus assembly protein PilW [Pseudomonas sp. BAgro211]
MIAVAISLLIMVAVLTLYLNLRRTSDDMAKTNSLIENGRFAVGLLQEDLAHAGFW